MTLTGWFPLFLCAFPTLLFLSLDSFCLSVPLSLCPSDVCSSSRRSWTVFIQKVFTLGSLRTSGQRSILTAALL